jgi:hypothetical protein
MSFDFRIPHPLMQPTQWPDIDKFEGQILFDERLVEHLGGPFELFINRADAKKLLTKAETGTRFSNQDLRLWINELFPQSIKQFGSVPIHALGEEFSDELPKARVLPWREFGYFPGFVRALGLKADHAPEIFRFLNVDWARFCALFSVNSETKSSYDSANGAGLLFVNPTLQILKQGLTDAPSIVWRKNMLLHEALLNWQEAWIFEELSEHRVFSRRAIDTQLPDFNSIRPKGIEIGHPWAEIVDQLLHTGALVES